MPANGDNVRASLDARAKICYYGGMIAQLEHVLEAHAFLPIGEQNPKIKQLKGIVANSRPNPEKLFLAEGIWMLTLCEKFAAPLDSLFLCPEHIRTPEAAALADRLAARCEHRYILSEKTFAKVSERGQPDGLMALAKLPVFDLAAFRPAKNAVILVLDGIEIPGNVGTMLRMADGAGIDAVFFCNRKARMTHPKLIKGSQGAVLSVPRYEFASVEECAAWLTGHGFTIYLADTRAERYYYDEPFGKKTALVMGSERYGISREWYACCEHTLIAIPMEGSCDSLNVGVAATVLCYEAVKKNKFLRNRQTP